jgi:hypothetical protein
MALTPIESVRVICDDCGRKVTLQALDALDPKVVNPLGWHHGRPSVPKRLVDEMEPPVMDVCDDCFPIRFPEAIIAGA